MSESQHVFKVYLVGGHVIQFTADTFELRRSPSGGYESYDIKGLTKPMMVSFNLEHLVGWEQVR